MMRAPAGAGESFGPPNSGGKLFVLDLRFFLSIDWWNEGLLMLDFVQYRAFLALGFVKSNAFMALDFVQPLRFFWCSASSVAGDPFAF